MKKWIISLFVILVLCGLRFADPWFLDMVRLKAMDQHQRNQETDNLTTSLLLKSTIKRSENVVSGLGIERHLVKRLSNSIKQALALSLYLFYLQTQTVAVRIKSLLISSNKLLPS
jgi:hypothetical protein